MKNTKKNLRKEVYNRIKHKIKELTLFRMGVGVGWGGGGSAKKPHYQFFLCNFYKRRAYPQKLSDFWFKPLVSTGVKL